MVAIFTKNISLYAQPVTALEITISSQLVIIFVRLRTGCWIWGAKPPLKSLQINRSIKVRALPKPNKSNAKFKRLTQKCDP